MKHETLAATYLSAAFGEEVVEPVRLHVRAKRFLCWADFAYEDGLSDASRDSLVAQGGPFDKDEAVAFGTTPFSDQAIKVRAFDDHAKTPGVATPDLAHFLNAVRRCAL
jgi:predicted HD phosphohydrolase